MRAVALSDKTVQQKINDSFIPLKVVVQPGSKKLPIDWPALRGWHVSYFLMGRDECEGITCCSVVSPDLQTEYANTGSAFVWEMFDSIAYDAKKFAAMLDRAKQRATAEMDLLNDPTLTPGEQRRALAKLRSQTKRAIRKEGKLRLPPKGFSKDHAITLFEMTGDLPAKGQ